MSSSHHQVLTRLQKAKGQLPPPTAELGREMIEFFKQSVSRRQTRLAKIAECFGSLVPSTLIDHCALESLSKGSLTVIVDSAAHLYEFKQVLLAGLERQILIACRGAGLRKIVLKRGRWYDGDNPADRRVRFTR